MSYACRGFTCDQPAKCAAAHNCLYRSSAEERREFIEKHGTAWEVPRELGDFGSGTEWRLWWRGLNTGISPHGKTLKGCVEEFCAELNLRIEKLTALTDILIASSKGPNE
jgi:hypothetical protein